jgi:4-amino-4-deoxy-L-arabinose transferase-like glycosyltransferase
MPESTTIFRQGLDRVRRLPQSLQTHPYEWGLGVCLLLFIIYKARDLGLPFFWDELGVYGRAAIYMHDHTLSLQPRELPPELSRGHPLLVVFVYAALFRVFGANTTVAHVFTLLMALGLLGSVYWIARREWSAKVGLASVILLAIQPLFLAQSVLLLPELPLALAALWTMSFFMRRRYRLGGLCLALAIFIKESALVLGLVLGIIVMADWIRARPTWREVLWAALALIVPGLLYGAFLLIQHKQNGWYFFPLHEAHANFHWLAMKGKLTDYCNFIFMEQGRFPFLVIIGLWVVFRLAEKRTDGARFSFGIGWAFVLFTLAMLVFSAGNFFMKRYLLCLLPPLAMLTSRALCELGRNQARVLLLAALALAATQLPYLSSPTFNYDYDMSYRESTLIQRRAIRYVEMTVGLDKPILSMFPPVFGLEDPRYGYSVGKFASASHLILPGQQYLLGSENTNRYYPPAGLNLELVQTFTAPNYMSLFLYKILR